MDASKQRACGYLGTEKMVAANEVGEGVTENAQMD